MEIFQAGKNDIPRIIDIAEATWDHTYSGFIDQEQLDFMYERMYTPEALATQMDSGVTFLVCREKENNLGYVSYEFRIDTNGTHIIYVPKLYIKPEAQGRQLGKRLLDEVGKIGKSHHCECIELNVNRNNPAVHFYLKTGLTIFQTVDIPYDRFWLNDYVMRKPIR